MARGTLTTFEEFVLDLGKKIHSFPADTLKVMLLSVVPDASQTSPTYSDFSASEVVGTGYISGGESFTYSFTEINGAATLSGTSNPQWAQNASAPNDIRGAVIYNDSATSKNCIALIDLTTDGTNGVSLVDGPVTINWEPKIFVMS